MPKCNNPRTVRATPLVIWRSVVMVGVGMMIPPITPKVEKMRSLRRNSPDIVTSMRMMVNAQYSIMTMGSMNSIWFCVFIFEDMVSTNFFLSWMN